MTNFDPQEYPSRQNLERAYVKAEEEVEQLHVRLAAAEKVIEVARRVVDPWDTKHGPLDEPVPLYIKELTEALQDYDRD